MLKNNLYKNSGFTLIEIAIAIAIFGIAMSTLITLQTRLVDNFKREKSLFRAALAAQYLMTFIEIDSTPPAPVEISGDLSDALRKRGYFENNAFDNYEKEFNGWKYKQSVDSFDFAGVEDILRKVELVISWGESERDSTKLLYYIKTNKSIKLKNAE